MKTFLVSAAVATLAFASFVQSSAHASPVVPVVETNTAPESSFSVELPSDAPRVIEASPVVIVGTVAAKSAPKAEKVQGWFCTSMRQDLVGGYYADCKTSL